MRYCKDCKNYRQHWVWYKKRFINVDFGHCAVSRKKKCLTPETQGCKNWEDNAAALLQRKEDIEKTLKQMAKQLKEIYLLFNADK